MPLPKRKPGNLTVDGRTEKVLDTIKVILRTVWNRRYIEKYIDREARECFLLVRRRAKADYGDASIPNCYKVLAEARSQCAENRNYSLCQAIKGRVIEE